MKKNLVAIFGFLLSLAASAQFSTTPSTFEANQAVTLFFNKAGTPLASQTGTLYAHMGVTVNGNTWQNVIGQWADNVAQPAFTFVSGTTYKLDITPDLFSYFGVTAGSSITQICIVVRNATGSAQHSQGSFIEVGAFQANLTAPVLNSTTLLNSGGSLNITANNTARVHSSK